MKTPFKAVIGHAGNIGLRLILLGGLAGTMMGQGTSLCGKYSTVFTTTGPTCHRVGILPWLIGIPGQWETELRLGATGGAISFAFFSSLSMTSYNTNLVLEDSTFGSTFFEGMVGLDLSTHKSHWTRILGQCGYATGPCTPVSVTGSLIVTADGPNAAALDAVSASAVYKNTSNDTVVSEASAPVLFLDQAAVRWSAIFSETPRDQQSQPNASITTFAVANLSPDPQAVLIQVYDESGNLSASAKTPVLNPASASSNSTEILVGGVYADTLSIILGINLPVSNCSHCVSAPVFRGTVVFEGERGGSIAPVVFRFNGSAFIAVPVKAE